MKVYLAGAESSEYQKVLIMLRAPSLQTFMAPWSIVKMSALTSEPELVLGQKFSIPSTSTTKENHER